jgi:hypothetical protein
VKPLICLAGDTVYSTGTHYFFDTSIQAQLTEQVKNNEFEPIAAIPILLRFSPLNQILFTVAGSSESV